MHFSLLTGPGPVILMPGTDAVSPERHRHSADRARAGVTMTCVQGTTAGTGRVRERSTCG
jgi:hypothetical protein